MNFKETFNLEDTYVDENGVTWGPYINILAGSTVHRNTIPTTKVSFDLFNDYGIDLVVRNMYAESEYHQFVMTKSNNISTKSPYRVNLYKLIVAHNNTYVDLIINDKRGCARIQFRNNKLTTEDGAKVIKGLGGAKSLKLLTELLERDGIKLEDYAVDFEEGLELHLQDKIDNPRLIKVVDEEVIDQTLENCHHLDINSAYPAGIAHYYPEMKPTINRIYELRHEHPEYKDVLNMSIGMMESKLRNYKYNKLAMSAHKYTNDKIYEMTKHLVDTGRKPILYNTDGIWYQGDLLDIHETDLGGWKADHKHCTLRVKSRGAYEFIEDGKYTATLRGTTVLDRIKPRSEWQWGDIYVEEAEEYTTITAVDKIDDFIGLKRTISKEIV